jgi:hypothetical protein
MSESEDRDIMQAFASPCRVAKSLHRLILTDHKHFMTAEGFGVDELDDKI